MARMLVLSVLSQLVLLLAPVLSQPLNSTRAIQQQLECFTQGGGGGLSEVFIDAISDLEKYSWDDKISSCCATGSWLLYTDKEYNNEREGVAMYWIYGENTCLDMPDRFNNQASSLRYAGSRADWCFPSINLYYGQYFSGVDSAWYFKDMPSLGSLAVQSLIVSGDSAWTLYEGENYSGRSVCLPPSTSGACLPAVYLDYLVIGSVKKGCYGDTLEQSIIKQLK